LLNRYRSFILHGLSHDENRVRAKYNWLARYFNAVVSSTSPEMVVPDVGTLKADASQRANLLRLASRVLRSLAFLSERSTLPPPPIKLAKATIWIEAPSSA
jgi:hypothetical protein